MNNNANSQMNVDLLNKKPQFSNQVTSFSKPFFIRKETTLFEEPLINIQAITDEIGDNMYKLIDYFSNLAKELKIVEWLTVSNTTVKMINYIVRSKIHLTGKSNFYAYFSSYTSFEPNKADSSIDIFANSNGNFDYCYFHDCAKSCVIVRDFSWAKFTNCVFDKNFISVFVSNNSYAEFENCLFLDDSNISIFVTKLSQVQIKNCQFRGVNKAIFSKDETTIRIDDTYFNECLKGAATIANKSTLILKNVTVNDSSNTAIRVIGNSVIKAQNVTINNSRGNALNLENTSGYFNKCVFKNNTEYPTISVKGIKSNPTFTNCQVIENGETFAVVIKNCARPLFDNCLFSQCFTNCLSVSDFSMPSVQNCKFEKISKSWINVYGKSIITLVGEYVNDKIRLSKNSQRWNEEQLKEEEEKYIITEAEETKEANQETYCRSYKPPSYRETPKVEDMVDQSNISPLPLICVDKLNTDEEDHIDFKCCNHNNHNHNEELYISAQCGHCLCKDCCNEGHSNCPYCDTPIKSVKKVYKEEQCIICMDGAATTIITSCGHMCLCYKCALKCNEENFKCPLCNQTMSSYRYAFDE